MPLSFFFVSLCPSASLTLKGPLHTLTRAIKRDVYFIRKSRAYFFIIVSLFLSARSLLKSLSYLYKSNKERCIFYKEVTCLFLYHRLAVSISSLTL